MSATGPAELRDQPATALSLSIRRASRHDFPALQAFYQRDHGHRERLANERVHAWEFHDQPTGGAGKAHFFVAEANGALCGGIGYIEASLNVPGDVRRAVFPVNYFVGPDGKGLPALRLFRAVMSECEIVIGAYVSGDARRLMSKMGFIDRGRDLYAYHYGLQVKRTPGSRVAYSLRRCMEWVRRSIGRMLRPSVRYTTDPVLDCEATGAFARLPGLCHVVKTAQYMRWRYAESPLLDAQFVHQYDGAELIGLAVVHVDAKHRGPGGEMAPEMIILDVLWKRPGLLNLTGLLDEVIRTARATGCTLVASHALSLPMRRAFRWCLFRSKISHLGFMAYSKDPRIQQLFRESRALHFMLGDTDVY